MKRLDLPTVTRVQDGCNSLVEPPLDPDWDEPTKLAWHAAVTAHDTGLNITVHDGAWTVAGEPVPGYYGIAVGTSSASAFTYSQAWTYLNGVSTGARAKEAR